MPLRVIAVEGSAAMRGRQIGEALAASIHALLDLKRHDFAAAGADWAAQQEAFERAIARHAPQTWTEMRGIAASGLVDWDDLLLLATEYEFWIARSRAGEKCTGIVAANGGAAPIMGQTNDEDPAAWHGGAHDVVIHHRGPDLRTALYTHPGVPAYMGMNSAGLVVMWQYIDTGESDFVHGVPTTVLLREVLSCTDLPDAVAYLRQTPRASPNAFQIGHRDQGAVSIECSPDTFVLREIAAGCFCHTNHIITDDDLARRDTGLTRTASTSRLRLDAIRAAAPPERARMTAAEAMTVLSRPPITYERTLAAMVFEPEAGRMHIRFKGEPAGVFRAIDV